MKFVMIKMCKKLMMTCCHGISEPPQPHCFVMRKQ